ncbi:MAG: polyprenyl synthetase family protein [Betaproteobacteria bacterium]|nr:polyprenyl synthetase family protein [Betaproteobacteria bacterium]
MAEVDRVIHASLHSEVALVRQVSEYIIHGGGKRLRPALVLMSAGVMGYHGAGQHTLAAVVEFIHTATLLHDDVVDASDLRRGRETANALYGNAASVLVGDFLYSRAFQMMVALRNMHVMEVLSEATNIIAEGEVLQLMNCNEPDVDESAYLRVIRYKTAKLFEASGRLGAIVSGASAEQEEALGRFGMHLGTAFQLIDDVLDYSGDTDVIGKNVGDDLAEGKPTMPLIFAMKHADVADAELIREAIRQGDAGGFNDILAIVRKTGALDHARAQAESEAALARQALDGLPDSQYQEALLELTAFAVAREF